VAVPTKLLADKNNVSPGTTTRMLLRPGLRRFGRHLARLLIVLLLGGFCGATLTRLAPGFGMSEDELDSRLSASSMEALRQASGANQSLAAFYLHYWEGLLHGDLGRSQTLHQPVRRLLAERFPETLKSVGLGLAVGWLAGLSLAVAAVLARGGLADFLAGLAASILLCVPAAVLALLFVLVQAPERLVIGFIVFPKIFQLIRNLLMRAAEQPHVLTARAKGLGSFPILIRHILPVAAPQLLALAGVSISLAFAATIPVEVLCDLPGIGQLAWKAAMARDLVLLVNLTMIVTLLTLLANLAADLAGRKSGAGAA
jgi:peptide/nickel transport system permease protein